MKQILSILVTLVTILGCNLAKNDKIRSFMPGTYARYSDHEMRIEYDTLRIESIGEQGNNYRLIRSSRFQRKLDEKILPWEYTSEEWAGIYDESKGILNETKKGKVISFVPERNVLLVGTTEYKKIK